MLPGAEPRVEEAGRSRAVATLSRCASKPHRTAGGAGRERPASRRGSSSPHVRPPRFGGGWSWGCSSCSRSALITVSFREDDGGPLTRAQDAGAAVLRPVPGRRGPGRRAVRGRVPLGRRAAQRPLGRRPPRGGERASPPAARAGAARRARERAAACAAALPRRLPLPAGLRRPRGRGDRAPRGRLLAGDQRRRRLERRRAA